MMHISKKIAMSNKRYYLAKGKRIYGDFSTFAQGRVLSFCNSIEFSRDFGDYQDLVEVCEYGVGDGSFARNFLDNIQKINKKLYANLHYFLFDFSERMLSDAKKNLSRHKNAVSFQKLDVLETHRFPSFDYCRINELLSDLPADVYLRKGNSIYEYGGAYAKASDSVVSGFMERIDEGRAIPFNFKALEFLLLLLKSGKKGFRTDIFDYGFYFFDDIFSIPAEEWNRIIVRNYGGQLTVDLNFPLILSGLKAAGYNAAIQSQLEYAQKVTKKSLRCAGPSSKGKLDYLENKGKDDGIKEDDGYYHLRIGR